MAYKINNKCINCGACESVCPVGAITFDEKKQIFVIDSKICISCGLCASVCPVGAPNPDETK